MTAKRKRLDALEAQARGREDGAALAYLEGLSDAELDAVHAAVLRREGYPDPESEAVRVRVQIEAMTDEDLRATLARLTGGNL